MDSFSGPPDLPNMVTLNRSDSSLLDFLPGTLLPTARAVRVLVTSLKSLFTLLHPFVIKTMFLDERTITRREEMSLALRLLFSPKTDRMGCDPAPPALTGQTSESLPAPRRGNTKEVTLVALGEKFQIADE